MVGGGEASTCQMYVGGGGGGTQIHSKRGVPFPFKQLVQRWCLEVRSPTNWQLNHRFLELISKPIRPPQIQCVAVCGGGGGGGGGGGTIVLISTG